MYKKTITYTDFNDVRRTEDFYFHLSESELTEMQTSVPGGYNTMIENMIASKDVATLIKVIKDLIIKSYGVKSDDGRRFIKKPELTEEFTQTPAYNELYMALATDEKELSTFVNKIIPATLSEKLTKANVGKISAENKPTNE